MTSTIIILTTAILVLTIFLISAIIHILRIQKELKALGEEQHEQNMDIIKLMKSHRLNQDMLLQHIEILKYLCDQDPKLKAQQLMFGPMGEA